MKENAFYGASIPRTDGRMPLANLIENLARVMGIPNKRGIFIYNESGLSITVDDAKRTAVARYLGKMVYSSARYELFPGPWVDIVEAHRDEIEQIAKEADRAQIRREASRVIKEVAA